MNVTDADAAKMVNHNSEEYDCFEWRSINEAVSDSSLHAALHDSLESIAKVILD